MTSATLIRIARRRARVTQVELARRLGKSQTEIGRWERGDVTPSFETVQRIVRACGLQLTPQLANADDSYVPHIDRMLTLEPAARIQRAADQANALRRMRAAAGVAAVA